MTPGSILSWSPLDPFRPIRRFYQWVRVFSSLYRLFSALQARIAELESLLAQQDVYIEDLEREAQLRWRADLAAIERWRAAHPAMSKMWPEKSDLTLWLMDQCKTTSPPSSASASPPGA